MVPESIRSALEQLGAKIDTHRGTSTVEIPGGSMSFRFSPTGKIQFRHRNGDWERDQGFYREHPEVVVGHAADGEVRHEGEKHSLSVRQYRQTDGKGKHWLQHDFNFRYYPNGKTGDIGKLVNGQPGHAHGTPEALGFAKDVLLGKAPREAFVDWLADKHGIPGDDIKTNADPEKYARELSKHLEGGAT